MTVYALRKTTNNYSVGVGGFLMDPEDQTVYIDNEFRMRDDYPMCHIAAANTIHKLNKARFFNRREQAQAAIDQFQDPEGWEIIECVITIIE